MSVSMDEVEESQNVSDPKLKVKETGNTEEEEDTFDVKEDYGEDDEEPPPPPPEEDKELLFMIEFLVDTMRLKPDAFLGQKLDPCNLQGQNCITLTFLHFPEMNICEKDVDSERNVGEDVTVFNSGKSIVFALTDSQFEEPPPVFLQVAAYKEMPHGFYTPRIMVGKTKVDLSELFKMLFDKYDEKPDDLPVAKSIKDNYVLSTNGKKTAEVDIYIRLTCLGQNIVTEFQKADGLCDPILYKNLESEKVYECKQTIVKDDTLPAVGQPTAGRDCSSETRGKPNPEDENFEQICAEINGSVLVVDVEKSRRRDQPKPFKVEDFCDCDFPLPAELVEGISELSVTPVKFYGPQEIPDGGVGKCNNRIVFQVPPSMKLAQADGFSNMTYNVNTCNQGAAHGHGKTSYKIVKGKDFTRPSLPNDPERDVFQLKIIKKGRCSKGRGIVELEFKTPKEKIEPSPKPPYMIDRAVGQEKKKKDKRKKK